MDRGLMTRKKASADPRARRAERQSCSKAPPISHATGGYNRNRRNGINNGRYEWHRRHRSPDMTARLPSLSNDDINTTVYGSFGVIGRTNGVHHNGPARLCTRDQG